mmetsp:Transcript_7791/g.24452  ORF Transcript_7791/g.24452 Transcript_7791/m.24452 type:complete len:204 (+) Transcript_7791:625-1236(+)
MAPPKNESPTSVRSFNWFPSKAHSGTPSYSSLLPPLFCVEYDPFPSPTSYRSFFFRPKASSPSFHAGPFSCPAGAPGFVFTLFANMVKSHNISPGFTDLNGTVSLSTSAGNSQAFAASKSLKILTSSIAPYTCSMFSRSGFDSLSSLNNFSNSVACSAMLFSNSSEMQLFFSSISSSASLNPGAYGCAMFTSYPPPGPPKTFP